MHPKRSLDAMTGAGETVAGVTLRELTLGHALVLEKIGCPLLADKVDVAALRVLDLLPTIFVLSQPAAASLKMLSGGRDAFDQAVAAFGDTIGVRDGRPLCEAVGRIFQRVVGVAPQGGPEGNAPAATAGSSPSPEQPA